MKEKIYYSLNKYILILFYTLAPKVEILKKFNVQNICTVYMYIVAPPIKGTWCSNDYVSTFRFVDLLILIIIYEVSETGIKY